MLLKMSFDADSDEGSAAASVAVSLSNSAKTESSITACCASGTSETVLMSRTIFSTRTVMFEGSNSGASIERR